MIISLPQEHLHAILEDALIIENSVTHYDAWQTLLRTLRAATDDINTQKITDPEEGAGPNRLSPSRAESGPDESKINAETLARLFHETYEDLAPIHGYATREASAKPWTDVPDQNRNLMIHTAARVLARLKLGHLVPVGDAVMRAHSDRINAIRLGGELDRLCNGLTERGFAVVPRGHEARDEVDFALQVVEELVTVRAHLAAEVEAAHRWANEVATEHGLGGTAPVSTGDLLGAIRAHLKTVTDEEATTRAQLADEQSALGVVRSALATMSAREEGLTNERDQLGETVRRYRHVVQAAQAWAARITDPPNMWADGEDLALIAAVAELTDAQLRQTEPTNTEETADDAARRYAAELRRLVTGLAELGVPLLDGPGGKSAVTTALHRIATVKRGPGEALREQTREAQREARDLRAERDHARAALDRANGRFRAELADRGIAVELDPIRVALDEIDRLTVSNDGMVQRAAHRDSELVALREERLTLYRDLVKMMRTIEAPIDRPKPKLATGGIIPYTVTISTPMAVDGR